MKHPNFNKQIINTIENGKTTIDELKSIEPILIENCRSSAKLMNNYYFITVLLVIFWFLIDNSVIDEIKLFDINIKNKKLLLITIPFLSIASYYFSISYMAFNQLIDSGLKEIQKKIYPNLGNSSVLELTIYPSVIELEAIKVRLSNESYLTPLVF